MQCGLKSAYKYKNLCCFRRWIYSPLLRRIISHSFFLRIIYYKIRKNQPYFKGILLGKNIRKIHISRRAVLQYGSYRRICFWSENRFEFNAIFRFSPQISFKKIDNPFEPYCNTALRKTIFSFSKKQFLLIDVYTLA